VNVAEAISSDGELTPVSHDYVASPGGARTTSVQRTGSILQEAGTSLILRESFFGVRRFDDFQRNLAISRSVLSRRLKTLVDLGILERRRYQERPDRFEYRLTESGLELYPVFLAMKAWGDRWLGDDGEPVVLNHQLCGHVTHPRMTCDRCGEPVLARDIRYELEASGRRSRA
jgi:DNA-binding HxlR family transcriptional regulator